MEESTIIMDPGAIARGQCEGVEIDRTAARSAPPQNSFQRR